MQEQVAVRAAQAKPIALLEIGGGIGTMVERILEDAQVPVADYHLLDEQADNIAAAYARLQKLRTSKPATMPNRFAVDAAHQFPVTMHDRAAMNVSLYCADLFEFLQQAGSLAAVNILMAHAFMDLVNVPATLPKLTATFSPGTLLYLTINFDGATIFEPTIDHAFDMMLEQLYHRTMDERITNGQPSGDSHTGRHLYHQLRAAGITTLAAGASDWVVIPQRGGYPHDEAYFLHFIIHTMHGALRNHPEVDAARFEAWINKRHAQIECGELVYIAHQLDYLGAYHAGTNSGASIETSRPST